MKVVHILDKSKEAGYCGQPIHTIKKRWDERTKGESFDGWCTIELIEEYCTDNPVPFEWCEDCLASPDYHLAALAQVP